VTTAVNSVQPRKPLRNVTCKCATCEKKFKSRRADAHYCSGACRQQAHRLRTTGSTLENLDQEIDRARHRYWALIAIKAHTLGIGRVEVLSGESQWVDEAGNVFMRGVLVGHVTPARPGWTSWGLEAAGPPYAPPGPSGRGYYESTLLAGAAKSVTGKARKRSRKETEAATTTAVAAAAVGMDFGKAATNGHHKTCGARATS